LTESEWYNVTADVIQIVMMMKFPAKNDDDKYANCDNNDEYDDVVVINDDDGT